MRPLRGQTLRGPKPLELEIRFDLSSIISGESTSACGTVVFNLFTPVHLHDIYPLLYCSNTKERANIITVDLLLKPNGFSLIPCCVLHRLETRICRNTGLPDGTVAYFFRFFSFSSSFPFWRRNRQGRCTPFWRSPLLSRFEAKSTIWKILMMVL